MEMEQSSLNMEGSDSEEELLGMEADHSRRSDSRVDSGSENDFYGFYDSSEPETYSHVYNDSDLDSDINYDDDEDSSFLSERAWGIDDQVFYNADFVDEDYEGTVDENDMDLAELEEEEAERIQRRLNCDLNETDFVIALRAGERQTTENEKFEEVSRNLSSLSTRQKLDLMQKESPEFFVLVQDLKNKLNEIDNVLIPVLNFFGNKNDMPAPVKFLKKKFLVLTNYCTNITFYLLLKAKRSPIENHPVLKSLYKYRRVMEEIQEIDEAMRPKIEKVVTDLRDNKNPALQKLANALKKKNILKLIKQSRQDIMLPRGLEANIARPAARPSEGTSPGTSGIQVKKGSGPKKDAGKSGKPDKGKRAITYRMAKNKGLIPRRNKLQRNPRVKHRNKYKKALIKRRGQMRFARTEIPAYGGEPSGIKSNVTKSIKFK